MLNRFKNILTSVKSLKNLHANYSINQIKTDERFSLKNINLIKYMKKLQLEFCNLQSGHKMTENDQIRYHEISSAVDNFQKINNVLENIKSLKCLKYDKDDMKELILEEIQVYSNMLNDLESSLMKDLLNLVEVKNFRSLIFEINAGVGGQEAMLFADELFEMYSNYIIYKGWELELLQMDKSDIGGLRYVNGIVHGTDAYEVLKNEAGVHRVQRIPATEKSGRMHTSTVSVAIIPRPDNIKLALNNKFLKIETKRASGAGGQHVNTTDSAVRIVHIPTGIAVECQSERSQFKNKEIALKKLENLMLQKNYNDQETSKQEQRKSQVGSCNRNEKIRTYNFAQDRITDHRFNGQTIYNLKEFFHGTDLLNNLITKILENSRRERLLHIIQN